MYNRKPILERMKELMGDGGKWTRGAWARDKNCHVVTPRSPTAVCFCMLGGLERAASDVARSVRREREMGYDHGVRYQYDISGIAQHLIEAALVKYHTENDYPMNFFGAKKEAGFYTRFDIANWNDTFATPEHVVKVLDVALEIKLSELPREVLTDIYRRTLPRDERFYEAIEVTPGDWKNRHCIKVEGKLVAFDTFTTEEIIERIGKV